MGKRSRSRRRTTTKVQHTRALSAPTPATQQAYEAAGVGRRLGKWDAPDLSPREAATLELQILRRRTRAGVRNNPWIARSNNVAVSNEIGTGITPRPAGPDKDFNGALLELWHDYVDHCDSDGLLSVYAMQAAAVSTRRVSGEAFIIIRRNRAARNSPVPLQFQLVEADLCPVDLTIIKSTGNSIITGVEITPGGRVVAYWFYKSHPADGFGANLANLVRIKSTDVIHHFIPTRHGALRGVPAGVQSIVRAYTFDKYEDAELVRKESRASFTGVIRRPDYGAVDYKFDPISGVPITTDGDGVPMIEMETGTFPSLLPGEDVSLFDGDDAGRGYADFQRWQMYGVCAGEGTPYQLVTGDYTGINDRLWRAIMNQYHREIEQTQDLYIIPQVCRRMWIEFVDRAVMSGAVDAPNDFAQARTKYIRAKHRAPAFKHIHPTQDVQATVLEIDNKLISRQKAIDERRGEVAEEVDEQRAEDAKRESALGLDQLLPSDQNKGK